MKSVTVWVFNLGLCLFYNFLSNQSIVSVTCNGMRVLVMFVDVYEKCDHLLFGFVFVYKHFVCRGHCVSQWTQVFVGLEF